jgi:hypothetical protein
VLQRAARPLHGSGDAGETNLRAGGGGEEGRVRNTSGLAATAEASKCAFSQHACMVHTPRPSRCVEQACASAHPRRCVCHCTWSPGLAACPPASSRPPLTNGTSSSLSKSTRRPLASVTCGSAAGAASDMLFFCCISSGVMSQTVTYTHAHTHPSTHTHTRTHTHTHTQTHTKTHTHAHALTDAQGLGHRSRVRNRRRRATPQAGSLRRPLLPSNCQNNVRAPPV